MKKIKNIHDLNEQLVALEKDKQRLEKEISRDFGDLKFSCSSITRQWQFNLWEKLFFPSLSGIWRFIKRSTYKKAGRFFK